MTDTYLRSLGFVSTARGAKASQAEFAQSWRYQFDHLAQDGTPLYLEHPLGIDACRLSALAAPLTDQDIFAEMPLNNRLMLETAMRAFYALHGGMGDVVKSIVSPGPRPYHRAV